MIASCKRPIGQMNHGVIGPLHRAVKALPLFSLKENRSQRSDYHLLSFNSFPMRTEGKALLLLIILLRVKEYTT